MAVSPAGEATTTTRLKKGAAPVARARNIWPSASAAGLRKVQQVQPNGWLGVANGKAHYVAFRRHGLPVFHQDGIVGVGRDAEKNRYSHI